MDDVHVGIALKTMFAIRGDIAFCLAEEVSNLMTDFSLRDRGTGGTTSEVVSGSVLEVSCRLFVMVELGEVGFIP